MARSAPVPVFKCSENLAVLAQDDPWRLAALLEPYRDLPVCDARSEFILRNLTERLNLHVTPRVPGICSERYNVLEVLVGRTPDRDILDLIKLVLSLGADPEGGPLAYGHGDHSSPLDLAIEAGNYEAVKLMLLVGMRDGCMPKHTNSVMFREIKQRADDIRCSVAVDRYIEDGRTSLSRLLIEGHGYALLGRMRSGKVYKSDFTEMYNGKRFSEWAAIFRSFRGIPEMSFRYGLDVPGIDGQVERHPEAMSDLARPTVKSIADGHYRRLTEKLRFIEAKSDELDRFTAQTESLVIRCRESLQVREDEEEESVVIRADGTGEDGSCAEDSDENYVPPRKSRRGTVIRALDPDVEEAILEFSAYEPPSTDSTSSSSDSGTGDSYDVDVVEISESNSNFNGTTQ